MTASSNEQTNQAQRFALRARAALFAFTLLGSAFLVVQLWVNFPLVLGLLFGLLLWGIGYVLLHDGMKQQLQRLNDTHAAPLFHPRLIGVMSVLLLSILPIVWVLVLNFSPFYTVPNALRIGLVLSAYLTVGFGGFLLLDKWHKHRDKSLKAASTPVLNALLLAALLATMGCYGLQRYNQHQMQQAENALDSRAELLLDLMENSVRVHLHNNRYMPDRLNEAFEALSNIDQVLGARLYTQRGDVIIEAWPIDQESPFDDTLYDRDDVLLDTRKASLDRPNHPLGMGMRGGGGRGPRGMGGQGQQAWEPFPNGPHQLLIVLDRSTLQEAIATIHRNTLLGLLALGLVALSTVGVGWSRYRRLELESNLVVAREQAAHLERLAQMGAGLAHETKNPLGIVRGLAQSIFNNSEDIDTSRQYAQDIVDESDRIVGQINRFLKLARPEAPRQETIVVERFLQDLYSLIKQESEDRRLTLQMETQVDKIMADPEQLRQILLNLLLNAFAACEAGDNISVHCEPVAPHQAMLRVADSGCGITPEDLEKVRQPYFTKFPGGTGLGLALVDEIVRNHGWRLDIASTPGEGTTVSIHGLKTVP